MFVQQHNYTYTMASPLNSTLYLLQVGFISVHRDNSVYPQELFIPTSQISKIANKYFQTYSICPVVKVFEIRDLEEFTEDWLKEKLKFFR